MKFSLPILKSAKFRNRSVRLKKVWDKQRMRFYEGFNIGLVSTESGRLYVNQMKVICRTVAKYIKQRGRMSRKERFLRSQRRSKGKLKLKIHIDRDILRRYRIRKSRARIRLKSKTEDDYKKFTISFFPQISITKKPIGVRMGKGKGAINKWGMIIKRGRVSLQTRDVARIELAFKCLRQVKFRIPFKSRIICRNIADRRLICSFYRINKKKF